MPGRRVIAALSASALIVASILAACSGFSSEETAPTTDASVVGDTGDTNSTDASDAGSTSKRFCETEVGHTLCIDFDSPGQTSSLQLSGKATGTIELSEAGAASLPFAERFQIGLDASSEAGPGGEFAKRLLYWQPLPSEAITNVRVDGVFTVLEFPSAGSVTGPLLQLSVANADSGSSDIYANVNLTPIGSSVSCTLLVFNTSTPASSPTMSCGTFEKGARYSFSLSATAGGADAGVIATARFAPFGSDLGQQIEWPATGATSIVLAGIGVQGAILGTWAVAYDNFTIDVNR